jgi:charged multivesicular body protein 1
MGIFALLNPKKRAQKRLEEQIYNLKFTLKQMQRQAEKCSKQRFRSKQKCKDAMRQQNFEGAKIYAEESIRKQNEQLNLLRLCSRIDMVCSRLETQSRMNEVQDGIGEVVKALEINLKMDDLEKASLTMERFERQFESLDVRTSLVQDVIAEDKGGIRVGTEVDVQMLMKEIADENGLELSIEMPSVSLGGRASASTGKATVGSKDKEVDEIERRLEALK